METPVSQPEQSVKKNQTQLIIASAAAVLCCCTAILVSLGFYGYRTYRSTSPIQSEPTEDFTPVLPDTDFPTAMPEEDFLFDSPPAGGLGNDILKNDTWLVITGAAIGLGCDQPIGSESTIEVLQEPENSIWIEKWTVACESGDSYAFEVEFILDSTGATFNIKSLP